MPQSDTVQTPIFILWKKSLKLRLLIIYVLLAGLHLQAELLPQDGGPPVKVIDMHTHVFNARDLALKGMIYSLGVRPSGIADILAEILYSWTPIDDHNQLEIQIQSMEHTPEAVAARIRLKKEANTKNRSLKTAVQSDLITGKQRNALASYTGQIEKSQPRAKSQAEQDELDVKLVADALDKVGFPPEESQFGNELKTLGVGDLLSFVDVMTDTHAKIVQRLRSFEYPEADLFVHHMMDMEKPYNDKPRVPFYKQITKMAELDRSQDGALVHFVAFDPFRRKDALSLATNGFSNSGGAIGMKFYPPSGYTALSNTIPCKPGFFRFTARGQWNSRYSGLDGKDLDAINRSFFAYCVSNDVPIFTHCTPVGFEAVKGYGWNCDPKFWEIALNEFPSLRLCFGHAGGEPYWVSKPDPTDTNNAVAISFGAKAIELSLIYSNVFCDMGYLDEILQSDGMARFQSRLKDVINQHSTNGNWSFGDKIMYGTDWHMMHKVAGHTNYLSVMDKVFSDPVLKEWHRSFFSGNAVHFLKLEEQADCARFTAQRNKWKKISASTGRWPKNVSH